MRTAASLTFLGAALAAAAPQDLGAIGSQIASELPSLVSDLGPLASADAPQISAFLQSLSIPGVAPTVAISQLPAVLSSELPALETAAFGLLSGFLPPDQLSIIETAAPPVFTAVASNLGGLLSQLPSSLLAEPVTALGPYLASNLPAIESAILPEISALEPEASSYLTALGGLATGTGAGTTGLPSPTATATGFSGVTTPTAPIATFTGAANANGWGKEVAGAAAVAGIVGALL